MNKYIEECESLIRKSSSEHYELVLKNKADLEVLAVEKLVKLK